MNRRGIWTVGLAIVAMGFFLSPTSGQEGKGKGKDKSKGQAYGHDDHAGHDHGKGEGHGGHAGHGDGQEMDPEQAAKMAMWMKSMTPGQHHGHLQAMAGKWKAIIKHKMSPDQPWEESKGESSGEMVMGGRYLLQKFSGEGMMGMPFEGLGIVGYDNMKKKYVSMWIDNMGTMLWVAEGTCDGSGKVITFHNTFLDPMTGKETEATTIYRIESPDRYIMEMFGLTPEGKEYKSLDIAYTRVDVG